VRTTINIDDDVYLRIKHLAQAVQKPIGDVLSETARKGLEVRFINIESDGFPVIPMKPNAKPMTLEMVNELRDAGY
jgi:hypothetical protein